MSSPLTWFNVLLFLMNILFPAVYRIYFFLVFFDNKHAMLQLYCVLFKLSTFKCVINYVKAFAYSLNYSTLLLKRLLKLNKECFILLFFSSPEHKVLRVSYCDRPLSVVVRRSSSVNLFTRSSTSFIFKLPKHLLF